MAKSKPASRYRVLPLPVVQREARKMLSPQQLAEGITQVKGLRAYPEIHDLSIEPCGDGIELRVESGSINQQGWLRAIFWVHEASRTIYVVDLFWKKTNRVSVADLHRLNDRIRKLKAQLAAGTSPWKSGK